MQFSVLYPYVFRASAPSSIGGEHKSYAFGVDDYAFAALILYADIMEMFTVLPPSWSIGTIRANANALPSGM
mgnify:CR=1 FL=1